MREMIKEFEEAPIEKKEDNRLELHSLSRKEKRKYKKQQIEETTADMSPSEKRKYLLYYHKERIIITVALIVVLTILGIQIYKGTRPITISYAVINCRNQLEFNADAFEQYAKDIGKSNGYQIKAETNVELKQDEYTKSYEENANSQKYINFETMATADYYDIIFTDMEGAVYCGMMDTFYPLDRFLDQAHYDKVKDRIIKLKNMKGEPTEYAIDISDTDFAKSLNLGYDDIYIGFPGDQQENHDRVNWFIDYLFP